MMQSTRALVRELCRRKSACIGDDGKGKRPALRHVVRGGESSVVDAIGARKNLGQDPRRVAKRRSNAAILVADLRLFGG